MLQIQFKHLFQIQDHRLIINKRQHDHTIRILQLGMFIQLVQYNIRISILFQFNHDTKAFTAGFITKIRNTFNPFIFYQLGNFFNEFCLVDHIRQLCGYNTMTTIRHCLDIRHCSYF